MSTGPNGRRWNLFFLLFFWLVEPKGPINSGGFEVKCDYVAGVFIFGRLRAREVPANASEVAANGSAQEADFAVSLEVILEKDISGNLKAVALESGPARVVKRCPTEREVAADGGARETDCAMSLEVIFEKDAACDLKAVAAEGLPVRVPERSPITFQIASDGGTQEAYLAVSLEVIPEKDAACDLDAVAMESVSILVLRARVPERSPITFQIDSDGGAQKADLAVGLEALVKKDVACNLEAITMESVSILVLRARVLERSLTTFQLPADGGIQEAYFTIGLEFIFEKDISRDLKAVTIEGGSVLVLCARILECSPTAREVATNDGAQEADFAMSLEVIIERDVSRDLKAVTNESGSVVILCARVVKRSLTTFQIPADGGTQEAYFAVGLEIIIKKDAASDFKAVAMESGPARVLEHSPMAREVAADGSADHLD